VVPIIPGITSHPAKIERTIKTIAAHGASCTWRTEPETASRGFSSESSLIWPTGTDGCTQESIRASHIRMGSE